jgi:CubicO group peptidase (beta-lactamase class C family)
MRLAGSLALTILALVACSPAAAPAPSLAGPVAPQLPPRAPATAPEPPLPPLHADLGAWIDGYVSSFGRSWGEAYAMQGYVAVAHGGKIVFGKAYGHADKERAAEANAQTRFRIGSVTKPFTSIAIMQLAERRRVSLEDSIRKYVPEMAPAAEKVTLHYLLTHASGIPSYTDDESLMKRRDQPHTTAQMLASFKDAPLAFAPGEKFAYSNSNYYLLGVVIERVSGQSYEDYLRDHVLRPAGMSRTSTVDAATAPNSAVGYTTDADEAVVRVGPIDMSVPFAAGALRSTVDDLVAWDRALAGDTLLSVASKKQMHTAHRDDYACGWQRSTEAGELVLSHTGGIDGFTAYVARVPSKRLFVVALSNTDAFPAGRVGRPALTMALTGEKLEPPIEREVVAFDAAVVAGIAGEYVLSDASRQAMTGKLPPAVLASVEGLSITQERDAVFMKPSGQGRLRVYQAKDGGLFTKRAGVELRPLPSSARGKPVKELRLVQGALDLGYERAPVAKKPTR